MISNLKRFVADIFSGDPDSQIRKIQMAVDAGSLQPLVDNLSTDDLEYRNAIRRLSRKSKRVQALVLVRHGVLKPMCELLGSDDDELVRLLLESIKNILTVVTRHGQAETVAGSIKECMAVGKVLARENEELQKKASDIIEKFLKGSFRI